MNRIAHRSNVRLVRSPILAAAVAAAVWSAAPAFAQVSTLDLNFNGSGSTVAATGFDAAYNLNPSGFAVSGGKLNVLTGTGDIYGRYLPSDGDDPDDGQNVFYTNFAVGDRTVLEARITADNLNNGFHGGGIYMGTDEDHYIRAGVLFNQGDPNITTDDRITAEAIRENEDRWVNPANKYPNRPGFDIEGRDVDTIAPVGTASVDAIIRIVRDSAAAAAYVSNDNGVTFRRIGGFDYSFNSLMTSATSIPVDNRTVLNGSPTGISTASPSVEGGFKVGVFAFGGDQANQAIIRFDSVTARSGTPTWTAAGSGAFYNAANWNVVGPAGNIESNAVFGATAAAATIDTTNTLGAPATGGGPNTAQRVTVTDLTLDNPAGYTFSGTGEVRFDWFYFPSHPNYYTNGPGVVAVQRGNQLITAPSVIAHMHTFDIASTGSLKLTNLGASPVGATDAGILKTNAGTLEVNRLLTPNIDVQAGTLKVTANGAASNVSTVSALTVVTTAGSTAKLDLTNNSLVVDYTGASSPLAAVTALVKSGRGATGVWNGPGVTSSSAAADSTKSIGIGEASSLASVPAFFGTVDATAILVRYTFTGDATLDGTVNFDDLVPLAQNYNGSGKVWTQGDFNYDGTVNFDDLVPLAQNYNKSGPVPAITAAQFGGDFASDWVLAQSLVPEPTTLAAAGMIGSSLLRRRRR